MQISSSEEKKGRDLTQSYDKSPYTNRSVRQSDNMKTSPKRLYTAIADRTDLGRLV